MSLPTVAEIVEKMLPANCMPSPESPEKRTTIWSTFCVFVVSAILWSFLKKNCLLPSNFVNIYEKWKYFQTKKYKWQKLVASAICRIMFLSNYYISPIPPISSYPPPFCISCICLGFGFFAFMLPKLYVRVKPNVRPPCEFLE